MVRKRNYKTAEEKAHRILCKFSLSSQHSFLELNLRLIFDLICINNFTKILKQPSLSLVILTKTRAQNGRDDNYLVFIVNNSQLFI